MNYFSLQNYFYIMKNTFKKKSLNRILQEIYAQKKIASGKIAEFGAQYQSSKNFINYINLNYESDIYFYDKFPKNEKTIKQDLEIKLTLNDELFDYVIIFNVLEHVYNADNAFFEMNRCLKKNSGTIIGSTPFIHRIHGAPNDYNRYTKQYIEKILERNNYKNIKVENLGFGAFTSAYVIIFDYLKLIPFLNNIILTLCLIIDKAISLFVKTKTENIYPIAVCFTAEKK